MSEGKPFSETGLIMASQFRSVHLMSDGSPIEGVPREVLKEALAKERARRGVAAPPRTLQEALTAQRAKPAPVDLKAALGAGVQPPTGHDAAPAPTVAASAGAPAAPDLAAAIRQRQK